MLHIYSTVKLDEIKTYILMVPVQTLDPQTLNITKVGQYKCQTYKCHNLDEFEKKTIAL